MLPAAGIKIICLAVSQTGLHTITVVFACYGFFFSLRFQVCLVEFPSHPVTLPKPQPLPALGFRVVSLNPDVPLPVGGIRSMWANVLCVLHVKVRLEAEVASGVTEELFISPSPSLHRFRPNGRLLDLRRGGSLEKQTLKLICVWKIFWIHCQNISWPLFQEINLTIDFSTIILSRF